MRGAGGEFRYNLVAEAGHEFLWPETGGSIHHNVFSGGLSDVASICLPDQVTGVKVFNNTLDGQLSADMVTALSMGKGTSSSLSSNAFINVPMPTGAAAGATVTIGDGTLSADYNAFGNPQTARYSDGRTPAHDIMVDGAGAAMLTDLPTGPIGHGRRRAVEARGRRCATSWPATAGATRPRRQPAHRQGRSRGGVGNDIGAVGAGAPNAADKFGRF